MPATPAPFAPPWRRALALVIDTVAAWLVLALLIQPLVAQGNLRLPTPVIALAREACEPLDAAPAWLGELLQGRAVSHLRVCEQRLFGLSNGRALIAILSEETDAQGNRISQFLRIPVDGALNPAGLYDVSGLLLLVLLGAGSAALHALGRPTPGRAVMRLTLRGPARRAPLREVLRLGPALLVLALPLVMPFRTLAALPPWAVVALVAGAVAAWMAWVGLRFFTHGAAPRHDRLSGFSVTGP